MAEAVYKGDKKVDEMVESEGEFLSGNSQEER